MKFKNIIVGILLISASSLALTSENSMLQRSAIFSSLTELNIAVNSSVENTITNGDSLTLIINEVVISDKFTNAPRIIEIECEFSTYDGKTMTFSTVQRSMIDKGQSKTVINIDYSEIISSQPLANIEKIFLRFKLRPTTDDGAELFKNISSLLTQAIPGSQAIDVLRSVVPTSEDEEVPPIQATFYIPNNFHHFEKIKNSGLSTPILTPDKPIEIVFSVEENTLPKSILKNIFNAVSNTDYFKDKNLISGYVKITPTKLLKKQINEKLMDKLTESFNFIVSSEEGKIKSAETAMEQAETMIDVYYPKHNSVERINSIMFVRLMRLFSKFENGIDYKLAPQFSTWVSYTNEFAVIQGVDKVLVDNYYGKNLAALFFFPTQMDNHLVSGSLYMQKQLHKSMQGLDRVKWGHLVKRVSESTARSDVATRN